MPRAMPSLKRDRLPAEAFDASIAAWSRRRLRTLAGLSVAVVAAATLIIRLLPEPGRTDVEVFAFTGLALMGGLPLVASFIQYIVLGAHRYFSGYNRVGPSYPRTAIVVPAWNEEDVIQATIERLLRMDYPGDRLRVYVVDDASTDNTPNVVRDQMKLHPGRVEHLRRERGGEGKAHTLNFGIREILSDDWAEAVLIIDADVLFEDTALRRMTRHLADPAIGAVTSYIKEGSVGGNYLTRFIGFEYITAQAASRRAQNVFGALACLAGGAQLHTRENLVSIGGRIDTSSLAEDTVTTLKTQLGGRRVVFDGNATVWAEEPGDIVGLWKQRLRWARGNTQISVQFSDIWLRGGKFGKLGGVLFSFLWFVILLMPIFMICATIGLLGLFLLHTGAGWSVFRKLWVFHAIMYVFVTLMSFSLDGKTARRVWREGMLFPGIISLVIMAYSVAPVQVSDLFSGMLAAFNMQITHGGSVAIYIFMVAWLSLSMAVAYCAKEIAGLPGGRVASAFLIYVGGYGPFLTAVTFAAFVRELQGTTLKWDKTVKTGKVALPT